MKRGTSDRLSSWISGVVVVALALLLGLGTLPGIAQAKVFGYGNKVCIDYVDESDTPELRRMYMSWAQGYFSSISYREGLSDFTRGFGDDPNAMQKWLQRYCERRNSKKFYEAVDAYAQDLIKFGAQKTR